MVFPKAAVVYVGLVLADAVVCLVLAVDLADIFCQAFDIKNVDNCAFLPKIMSRKKQVIPMLSALWG